MVISSTTGHHFCIDPASSFFLELLVIAFPTFLVAYWTPSDLGGLSSGCRIFLPFHTAHEVVVAKIVEWFTIPFSREPCFVRTLHDDPYVVGSLHRMAYSFTEFCKPIHHDKAVIHEGVVGPRSPFSCWLPARGYHQFPQTTHILCLMASSVFKASRGELLMHQIPSSLNLCSLPYLTSRVHVMRSG